MTGPTASRGWVVTSLELLGAGRAFAVVTVLEADHSTPVPAGARAIVEADGTIHGTVGGGFAEAESQRHAISALQTGRPVTFSVALQGPGGEDPRPICGGSMRLLIDPTAAVYGEAFRRAVAALERRQRGLWITSLTQLDGLEVTSRFVPEADVGSTGTGVDVAELRGCLEREETGLFAAPDSPGAERVEVFVEPLVPRPVLLVVGAGHVGRATAVQAARVGFNVVVIDDRSEFADPARFPPDVNVRCGDVVREVEAFPIHPDTFVVLVTRGHRQDSAALRVCIRRPAAYIGMIGSRRKVPLVRRQFLEEGWASDEEFDRVYAPIGLDLGAITVPEIATSIVAQLIAVRRKRTAARIPST